MDSARFMGQQVCRPLAAFVAPEVNGLVLPGCLSGLLAAGCVEWCMVSGGVETGSESLTCSSSEELAGFPYHCALMSLCLFLSVCARDFLCICSSLR
jgi:hypothetical protein